MLNDTAHVARLGLLCVCLFCSLAYEELPVCW
jgi:hypothetical protein